MSYKAAVIYDYAESFDAVKIAEFPKPQAIPGTVLVKVKAAASNPVDTVILKGYMKGLGEIPFPYTLGCDYAGVVESVGEGVTNVAVGEKIITCNWGDKSHIKGLPVSGGGFAEYAIVKADLIAKLPEGVSFQQGAAIGAVGLTAYQVLKELEISAGQKILVLGGSSAVGQFTIQLAKLYGATVYTTASSRTYNFVVGLNAATKVINYNEVAWETDPDIQGIDAVFDTVGDTGAFAKTKTVAKPGGKYISIANYDVGFNPAAHPPLSYAAFFNVSGNGEQLGYLVNLVKEGKLKVTVDEEFPFSHKGVQDIFTKTAGKKSLGKNILVFN